jgi:hypothetical protein
MNFHSSCSSSNANVSSNVRTKEVLPTPENPTTITLKFETLLFRDLGAISKFNLSVKEEEKKGGLLSLNKFNFLV